MKKWLGTIANKEIIEIQNKVERNKYTQTMKKAKADFDKA